MLCSRCGAELIAGKRFCHACGTRVDLTCSSCGAPLERHFRFCPHCGAEVRTESPARTAPLEENRFARLVQHIPGHLAEKIRASQGTLRGERKLVTVVFCDLVGSTAIAELLDPEEYRDLLDQYLELAFREIYRFEGIVNQLAGDGMMALFGAPVAHEDAPQRAVRAALAIRSALGDFNERRLARRDLELQARMGIHTGSVVVGTVGNNFKMDYTATGDTTNLAARLESLAAPGTILISEATHRLVRGFFEVHPRGPFRVKGKTEPVTAYEVIRESETTTAIAVAAARGLTPLVGRRSELSRLLEAFERSKRRQTEIVAVVGGAGSGKSRLIYEFKRQVGVGAAVFFEARCSALTRFQPYAPVAAMLRPHFQLVPGLPVSAARDRVAAQLRAWSGPRESLEGLYPHLLRLFSLTADDGDGLPPDDLKLQIYEAVARVVRAASAAAPAVIIVEDLHWVDDASRDLIDLAVRRIGYGPLMLIVSHQPDYMPLWHAEAAFTPIELSRLGDDEVTAIIRAVSGGSLPPELERLICERTEGNPFFAEEMLRALIDDGVLVRRGAGVEVTRPLAEIPMPHTVQEVLEARLDRLDAQAKRVAQVAAVLGRQFNRRHLRRMLEAEGIAPELHLEELERRGIIHRKHVFSDDEYRFGESLTQEVAYEGLLVKERRQLHERAGSMLEELSDEAVADRAALAAFHFTRSDNPRRALAALLSAGRDAEQRPSWSAAENFYRQAWELAEPLVEAEPGDESLRRGAIDAAVNFCRLNRLYGSQVPPSFARALRRGRELAEQAGDVPSVAWLLVFEGMYLGSQRTHAAEGVRLVEEAFSLAQRSGLELAAVNLSRALSITYLFDGRFKLAERISQWTVNELARLGHAEKRSDLYVSACWLRDNIRFHSGDLAAAEQGLLATYAMAREVPNRTVQIMASASLAQLNFVAGEYETAKQWITRSLAEADAIGHGSALQMLSGLALAVDVELGVPVDLDKHLALIEEGISGGGNAVLFIRWIVDGLISLGALDTAESLAQKAHARAAGRLREMLAAAALARVFTGLGAKHWPDAEQWLRHALALAHGMEAPFVVATLLADRAGLEQARGNYNQAAEHASQALASCRAHGLRHYERKAERILLALAGAGTVQKEQGTLPGQR